MYGLWKIFGNPGIERGPRFDHLLVRHTRMFNRIFGQRLSARGIGFHKIFFHSKGNSDLIKSDFIESKIFFSNYHKISFNESTIPVSLIERPALIKYK